MSGVYFITIRLVTDGIPIIFTGSFVVDYDQSPNIIAFYEDGNPNNILAPTGSYGNNDNVFISRSYAFSPKGTNITYMSYYAGDYGSNNIPPPNGDGTYNLFSFLDDPFNNISEGTLENFPVSYRFSVTGGPVYPPFPLDQSIPPASFYTIQGLPMFLNQNVQYKVYYTDIPQFPYLTYFAKSVYSLGVSTIYKFEDVPLAPFLSNMNQSDF